MRKSVGGQDVWVVEQGAGDLRVFVHCSLGRHQSLMPLAGVLPPARDVFFDLPGHGSSADWTGDAYQTDVLRIIEDLADASVHLVGHSFGATAALRFAVEHPDRVTRLTLIEPVMFAAAQDRGGYDTSMISFIEAWKNKDLPAATVAFLRMWGAGPPLSDMPPAMREKLVSQIHMIPAAAPAIDLDVHGIMARLPNVQCPVDLIEGNQSQPVMSSILDGLAAGMPHAVRTCIKGAGHMVPITHAADVASALQRR